MARITVEDCTEVVPNRYELVLMAANRARLLGKGRPAGVAHEQDKNTVIALREIAAGKVGKELLNPPVPPAPVL